jgi:hypothetical protein
MMRAKMNQSRVFEEKRLLSRIEYLMIDSGICFGMFLFVFILFNLVVR